MVSLNLQSIKDLRIVNEIRNKFLFKPSIYLKPKSNDVSVSDFFFWSNKNQFETKFYITNLASQILPDLPQNDEVKIMIYDDQGNKIDLINLSLNPFETKEFLFNKKIFQNKFGSFFVFHNFRELGDLIKNGCHVADRGYTGYRRGDGVWSFVHGNHYSASIHQNYEVQSLMSRSFFKSEYKMQVSFVDSNSSELVINNPDKKIMKTDLLYFDENMKFIQKESMKVNGMNTIVYNLSKFKFKYIEIKSNVIFCRPLVIKYYDTYFDIFHA
tara:strand:+ start:1349 stop:2158 length:810 start_codon:yes stop_codon:yes gene_type:complete